MIIYEISENDGYLNMSDLPHNCIFNKVRTGCGGTTIALKNEENYVIAVPTTELIVNKCNSTDNLFGFHGEFNHSLEEDLKNYVSCTGVKKIMCTYDKVPLLLKYVNGNDYRLLVDEYHNLLKQYMFRSKAINGVLDNFKKFKSFCFMSATSLETELKPDVLKGIPEYVADWKDEQKLFITPLKTNKPYQYVVNFIRYYKMNGYITANGHNSREAYFFLNSVTEITNIINRCGLTNENCRVICADEEKNKKKLGDILISNSVSEAKQFNFVTCKSFEGADFFSESGLCFVVSNVNVKHTLASIDIDIPQIAGRIRNKENPFRNTLVHIFNTKNDDLFKSYEQVKNEAFRQIEIAKERVVAYNMFSLEAKKQQAQEVKDSLYIRYIDGLFEVNDRAINYKLYEYKLIHQIYSSSKAIEHAYSDSNIVYKKVRWKRFEDTGLKKYCKSPTFLEVAKQYNGLKFCLNNERLQIEKKYPFIREAFQILGFHEICKLRTIKLVKEALLRAKIAMKPNRHELFKLLSEELELGRFYETVVLKEICERHGLKRIKELKEWYDLQSGTKRVNGIPRSGYWIIAIIK